jgi:hypothetical protein
MPGKTGIFAVLGFGAAVAEIAASRIKVTAMTENRFIEMPL